MESRLGPRRHGLLRGGGLAPPERWSSRQEVRELLARLYAWRVGWRWYAFAVSFWPAAYGIGMAIDTARGGQKRRDYGYQ